MLGFIGRHWRLFVGLLLVVLIAAPLVGQHFINRIVTPPPAQPAVERVRWLEQNWTEDERHWFHHASQGTNTLVIPPEWFMALRRPKLSYFEEVGKLSAPDYLSGFGFIPSEQSAYNPYGLPVGFVVDENFIDPQTGEKRKALGFTCAACHTGQMIYNGVNVRIDGGTANVDLARLDKAVGISLALTNWFPWRFEKFADDIVGPDASKEERAALRKELADFIAEQAASLAVDDSEEGRKDDVAEGFARLDALNRIGNQVFAKTAGKPDNEVPTDAPVNFPHIWSTSWFDWVQYDGSIMQPIVRNAGEALGVGAGVMLTGPADKQFQSTVPVANMERIELLLAGTEAPYTAKRFTGLASPEWPEDVFGSIDRDLAGKGETLYRENCQMCHQAPVSSPEFFESSRWYNISFADGTETTQKYLSVSLLPQEVVGTDPTQTRILSERTIDTTGIAIPGAGPAQPFGEALAAVVQNTVNYWYDSQTPPTPPEVRERMNGDRPNNLNTRETYKARPLNGIWATAPFLHNGSVPTLYHMLVPQAERPAVIYLGSLEFDPKHVGYVWEEVEGASKVDTSETGNLNIGHEFRDAPIGTEGVIGRLLTDEERWAIIEFLKTQ